MLRKSTLGIIPRIIPPSTCRNRLSGLSTSTAQRELEQDPSSSTYLNPRTIFVRPWNAIPTMAHVFAIARDIEKKFGKIDDIIVPRDPDVPTTYAPYFIATFAWEEDAEAIPREGTVIQVPTPNVRELRPGGVGLDDLEPYLDVNNRNRNLRLKDENTEASSSKSDDPEVKLMDVKLERSRMKHLPRIMDYSIKHRRQSPHGDKKSQKVQELAKAIVSFGGFTTPALPPNAPPSSFVRVVESWYNLMTPETRDNWLKDRQLQSQTDPQHSNTDASHTPELTDESTLTRSGVIAFDSRSNPIFASKHSIPSLDAHSIPSLSSTDSTPPAFSSIDLEPPLISSEEKITTLSATIPDANLTEPAPASISTSTSMPQSQPQSVGSSPLQPQLPKLSKRERLLMAVREAGKADAMKTRAQETENPTENLGPTQNDVSETASSSPNESDEGDPSKGSANWWNFLLGGNKDKQR